ncbi:MAG TPA: hypothetical protein VNL71_00680 [Chloroflexota bacterium]|nr:hypothetical protein [Chloroflexota bacterium]
MDTEDLLPRLALFAGIVAVIMIYRKRRGKIIAPAYAPSISGDERDGAASATASFASGAPGLAERGQGLFENVLDNIAEEALKELKTVVKDGLKRLEKTVDQL